MSLIVLCPSDWRAVSNSIERRFALREAESAQNGRHILERADIEWFLNFYDSDNDVAISEFE